MAGKFTALIGAAAIAAAGAWWLWSGPDHTQLHQDAGFGLSLIAEDFLILRPVDDRPIEDAGLAAFHAKRCAADKAGESVDVRYSRSCLVSDKGPALKTALSSDHIKGFADHAVDLCVTSKTCTPALAIAALADDPAFELVAQTLAELTLDGFELPQSALYGDQKTDFFCDPVFQRRIGTQRSAIEFCAEGPARTGQAADWRLILDQAD